MKTLARKRTCTGREISRDGQRAARRASPERRALEQGMAGKGKGGGEGHITFGDFARDWRRGQGWLAASLACFSGLLLWPASLACFSGLLLWPASLACLPLACLWLASGCLPNSVTPSGQAPPCLQLRPCQLVEGGLRSQVGFRYASVDGHSIPIRKEELGVGAAPSR